MAVCYGYLDWKGSVGLTRSMYEGIWQWSGHSHLSNPKKDTVVLTVKRCGNRCHIVSIDL